MSHGSTGSHSVKAQTYQYLTSNSEKYENELSLQEADSKLQDVNECEVSNEDISGNGSELRNEEAKKEKVEPDGGWGWMVVTGASLILVMVDTVGQCFGIIFSTFLSELQTPSTITALIFNMFGFTWCMTGPVLGPLVSEFGWRKVTFVSSIMLSFSTIASAFVPSPWALLFTYSFLGGIGCGILSNISYTIVPYYFRKRRGLANGIIMSWDCGGQLLGPPLIYFLQSEYAFSGATLILGGIVLHCCLGAAVFHPIEWHLKSQGCETENIGKVHERVGESCHSSGRPPKFSKCQWEILTGLIHSSIADLCILRSARAVIIATSAALIFNGYLNFLAFVPFAMQDSGFSLENAAWCVSVSAICNMLTRIIVSTLSDTRFFNFRTCYLMGSLTITITMIAFIHVRDIMWVTVVMGVWGCGVGAFMSIFNLVMVHYMGLKNFMAMLGATMLCIAGGYLTIGPFIGYIHDVTGRYEITTCVLASTVFCSFFLWLFMPAASTYDTRRSVVENVI
ncbi:hypothetical protein OTU49_016535 [Cherax quadricarinatus]|uniref:Monocarboxylate transporter n=2 Tax=Cherax quadricarinatus TaxID=27406 RepID=A0AAW0Y7F1_CHEQU